MLLQNIKDSLPYRKPFCFVDAYTHIDEHGAQGTYTFSSDEYFYQGHFPDLPITPGVILLETMAQIGLVGLGIFLTGYHEKKEALQIAFSSAEVEFLLPVYPNTKVLVKSEKIYFRLGKLKCKVAMTNEAGDKICSGILSGMMKRQQ